MDIPVLSQVIAVLNKIGKSTDNRYANTLFGNSIHMDRSACTWFGGWATSFTPTADSTWHTLVSITGKKGFLDSAGFWNTNSTNALSFRVTIDGTVTFYGVSASAGGGMISRAGGNFTFNGTNGPYITYPSFSTTTPLSFGNIGNASNVSWLSYTGGSGNQYCYHPDTWYFTNSVLIEYYCTASVGTQTYQYQGGYY